MGQPSVVIVGAGQGGFQVAASLRDEGFGGRIVMVGEEPPHPYQRPPLSKTYLIGKTSAEALLLRPRDYFAAQDIELRCGERVAFIDRAHQKIGVASGLEIAYDHLVLATGARPRTLDVPGETQDGVLSLRTLADADRLRAQLRGVQDIVVVGAGFIGLEFAAIARQFGARVHIIEIADRPMARAVSAETAHFFCSAHQAQGTQFSFATHLTNIIAGAGRVAGVETGDGRQLRADLIVVGAGATPNTELASAAGLAVLNGVVVDENLLTEDPAISAIGDCANFPSSVDGRRQRLESVQNAVDQARCVAARLAGFAARFDKTPWFWSDQGDHRLQIAGITAGYDTSIVRGDILTGRFSVFCFRRGTLLGVESVNRPADHMAGRKLLAHKLPLTHEQAADGAFDISSYAAGRMH